MVQIPSPQPFKNSSSNRTGCFAFSGEEAGLASTYTGEKKGGRSAPLSQADERLPAQFPCPRPKRRGVTGGTWFRPSARARPALRCRNGVSAATPAIRCGACYLPGRRGWQALLPTPQPPHWPHRQPQPPALRRFFMERRASAAHRARSPRITAVPMALRADRPAGTRRRRRARPRRTAAGRRLPPSSRNPAPAAPPQWPRCRAYRAA